LKLAQSKDRFNLSTFLRKVAPTPHVKVRRMRNYEIRELLKVVISSTRRGHEMVAKQTTRADLLPQRGGKSEVGPPINNNSHAK